GPVVGLGPPSVEHREVEAAVERSLHAAGTTRFERRTGNVDPHIAAGDHLVGGLEAVIVEKRDAAHRGGLALEREETLGGVLSLLVLWMRLAGKHHLRRTILVFEDAGGALAVERQQLDALVTRQAASEAERQRVLVEAVLSGLHVPAGLVARQTVGDAAH